MTEVDRIATALKAVGEPTRLRILLLLAHGELTVSEIVQVLGQSQPRVSRHLKLLSEAGVVERLPEGAWVFYRLADGDGGLRRAIDAAIGLVSHEDLPASRDLERLALVKRARADAAHAYFRSVAQEWDRIRSLHLSEEEVESAMREAAGEGPFELMVDIGAGTARVLQVFADRVSRGVGVDSSHEMLTVARHNLSKPDFGHLSVRHADLYALPFPDGGADLVVIHQVLHYLDEPALAILEAARILKLGGRLVIVDFAPHGHEFLRERHAHRRLGFADVEVADWASAAGLAIDPPRTLASHHGAGAEEEGLTVKIWRATQTRDAAARKRAG